MNGNSNKIKKLKTKFFNGINNNHLNNDNSNTELQSPIKIQQNTEHKTPANKSFISTPSSKYTPLKKRKSSKNQ